MIQTRDLNLVPESTHTYYMTLPPASDQGFITKEENFLVSKIINVLAVSWLKYNKSGDKGTIIR